MSCPFYGRCALPLLSAVTATSGNQCALAIEAFAPCAMETELGKTPDWPKCPRNVAGMQNRARMIEGWMQSGDGRERLLAVTRYPD